MLSDAVGVSSQVLVSCQDEAWSDDLPRSGGGGGGAPLPPVGAGSDLRLQQSPLCQ